MSSVINSINESFNRKLKESCEPKRAHKQTAPIKEGEQLNESAPIVAAVASQAIPALVGGLASSAGQALGNGMSQGMQEDADPVKDNKSTNHRIGKQSNKVMRRPQRKEVDEDLDDNSRFDLNSDVYNALAKIAFKYHKRGIDLTADDFITACEHFEIRFFDDGGKEDMFGE